MGEKQLSLEGENVFTEMELRTIQFYVLDSLALSVNTQQLDRDKAVELYESWFACSKQDIANLYRELYKASNP